MSDLKFMSIVISIVAFVWVLCMMGLHQIDKSDKERRGEAARVKHETYTVFDSPKGEFIIIEIDGCEYLWKEQFRGAVMAHKGGCKNCEKK